MVRLGAGEAVGVGVGVGVMLSVVCQLCLHGESRRFSGVLCQAEL